MVANQTSSSRFEQFEDPNARPDTVLLASSLCFGILVSFLVFRQLVLASLITTTLDALHTYGRVRPWEEEMRHRRVSSPLMRSHAFSCFLASFCLVSLPLFLSAFTLVYLSKLLRYHSVLQLSYASMACAFLHKACKLIGVCGLRSLSRSSREILGCCATSFHGR
jgi:hypothetical protein